MIPWTSSTHNFHFVAAFWFTHASLSYASTVSLTQLCVCVSDLLKFDPSTPFQSKSTHSRGCRLAQLIYTIIESLKPRALGLEIEAETRKGWKHCKLQMRPGDPWLPSQMSLMCSASPLHSARFHREMAGFPVSDGRQVYDRARNEKPKAAHQTLHSNQASLSLICHCLYRDCQ